MSERYKIRVSKDDKNQITWQLMREGEKIDDMTPIDLIELALQCTSALRFVGK
jgi:hypothetical protein